MAGGGWVATHEDVTHKLRAEQELAEAARELAQDCAARGAKPHHDHLVRARKVLLLQRGERLDLAFALLAAVAELHPEPVLREQDLGVGGLENTLRRHADVPWPEKPAAR